MLRRSVCAAVAVLVLGGFLIVETITGIVTKIDGDRVFVHVVEKGKGKKKGEKGEAKEFKLTAKTEFFKRGKDKDAEPEKSSKDDFLKAVEKGAEGKAKGIFATLDVDGGEIK